MKAWSLLCLQCCGQLNSSMCVYIFVWHTKWLSLQRSPPHFAPYILQVTCDLSNTRQKTRFHFMDLTAHSSTAWFLLFLKRIKINKSFLLQRFEWDLQPLAVNFTFLWFLWLPWATISIYSSFLSGFFGFCCMWRIKRCRLLNDCSWFIKLIGLQAQISCVFLFGLHVKSSFAFLHRYLFPPSVNQISNL